LSAGRLPRFQLQAQVEGLEARRLLTSPHFISASATLSGANVVVSFKEAGLGNNQLITYEATATATATYLCINNGGNHPQAANKETVSGPVSATGTFSSGKNGQVTASLTLTPPDAGDFHCPPGQKMVLAQVTYTNITLTDTTDNVTTSVDSGPLTFTDPRYANLI